MSDSSPIPATPKVECALALARRYPEDLMHAEQVARLAALLFDALRPLHGMGKAERELLACAALLHDIGLSVSSSGHHKHSLRLILEGDLPALAADEQRVVANIARYHRGASPKPAHEAFRLLSEKEQDLVRRLAAILRVADGLDRLHENAVAGLEAEAGTPRLWVIGIHGPGDLGYAAWGAGRKADLFEDVYGAAIRFEPRCPAARSCHNDKSG